MACCSTWLLKGPDLIYRQNKKAKDDVANMKLNRIIHPHVHVYTAHHAHLTAFEPLGTCCALLRETCRYHSTVESMY